MGKNDNGAPRDNEIIMQKQYVIKKRGQKRLFDKQ